MNESSMHPEVDAYPEGAQPYVIQQAPGRTSIWPAITRAVVSFTLLAVLLLAFGVAIAGWFIGTRIKDDLRTEIDRTPVQAHIVIAYRDALVRLTDQMSEDRVVLPPPDQSDLYDKVMVERGGRGGLPPSETGADNLQAQIDLLQRDNADLRWANLQLRQQSALSNNPPRPRRNQAP